MPHCYGNPSQPRKALETFVLSVLPSPPTGKHTFSHYRCPRHPIGALGILTVPSASCRCPRHPVGALGILTVPSHPVGACVSAPDVRNIRSPQRRTATAIHHSPASYRKHPFPKLPRSAAPTLATATTPRNICSPKPFPSHQHLCQQSKDNTLTDAKTYVLTIGAIARDAAPCRHFPEIGHVSPAQNRAASTQSSQ